MKPGLTSVFDHGWRVLSMRGPAVGFLLIVLVLFSDAFFRGRVFFQRDIHAYWYPTIEAFVGGVAEGRLPCWNPYPAFGLPLASDPSSQTFYPLTWLNLVLQPESYFKLFVAIHCFAAGLGVQKLCRRWRLTPVPSFLAGAVWIASGPFLSSVSLFHHFAGSAWMPWVLLALDAALSKGTIGSGLLLGAVAGGQALAGSADLCFMTGLLAVGYSCVFVVVRREPGSLRSAAVAGAISLPFAAVLSAVQWIPAAALVGSGYRGSQVPSTSLYWSLHPISLLDLLVPRLIADFPLSAAARAALFESREPLLVSIYLGVPAAVLVLCAGLLARATGKVSVVGGSFVLFLLAGLGRHTPLLPTLLQLPLFPLFRYPPKYLLPASLLWAVLAGLGAEAWMRPWQAAARRRSVVVVLVCAASALAALWASTAEGLELWNPSGPLGWLGDVGTHSPQVVTKLVRAAVLALVCAALLYLRRRWSTPPLWLNVVLVGVVMGDLLSKGRDVNPLAPPALMRYRPPILEELRGPDPGPRVYVFSEHAAWLRQQFVRSPEGWDPRWGWVLGGLDMLLPPIGGRWRIHGSYDGDFSGLAPRALSALTQRVWRGDAVALKLLEMGSVNYVVSLRPDVLGGLPEVAHFSSVYAQPIRLFRVPRPVARVYAVNQARILGEPESFGILEGADFDPRREVLLSEGPPPGPTRVDFVGKVRVLWRRSDSIGAEADLNASGFVVFVESYYTGWRAAVDGVPTAVRRANVLFRAVSVPAGRHRIELTYRPDGLMWGSILSFCGASGGLIYWEVCRKRNLRRGLISKTDRP